MAARSGGVRPSKASEGEEIGAGAQVASTANPFTEVRDLRDLRALETVADRVPWHLAGALALVMECCAPLADEKARKAVLAAVLKGSAHTVANKGAEPPAAVVTALRSHMVLAIADMRGGTPRRSTGSTRCSLRAATCQPRSRIWPSTLRLKTSSGSRTTHGCARLIRSCTQRSVVFDADRVVTADDTVDVDCHRDRQAFITPFVGRGVTIIQSAELNRAQCKLCVIHNMRWLVYTIFRLAGIVVNSGKRLVRV